MATNLRNVTGIRGEAIAELRLLEYEAFPGPLFRPKLLGEKWPVLDAYVELDGVDGLRPYFFAQVKSTRAPLTPGATRLRVSVKARDVGLMLQIPGPTYILGVHEPTQRVFVRSVHEGMPAKAITAIPLAHELTAAGLLTLHEEVRDFWMNGRPKPRTSVFA